MKHKINPFSIILPVVSVFTALVVGALIIGVQHINPLEAYYYLFRGAFGNRGAFGETMVKAIPLIFTGLAVTFAYRTGVFNIGAEGQFLIGALCGIWVSIRFSFLPGGLLLALILLAGTLGGFLWGIIPGWLKARKRINEIINTILMNYIALQLVSFAITGPLKEPPGYNPQTPAIKESARLARLVLGTRLHAGLIIALLLAACIYYVLFKTAFGFQLRAVGLNRDGAAYGGISVQRNIMLALALSGAAAGLGGAVELAGIQYRLIEGFGVGYGFDGIAVALIGQLHPVGVILSAFLFGVLRTGANTMQRTLGIPASVVDIIQALVIFFVVGAQTIRHPLRKRRKGVL